MHLALPFFAPTWGSNPVFGNGMIIITVILLVAVSVLLLYFRSKRIGRK